LQRSAAPIGGRSRDASDETLLPMSEINPSEPSGAGRTPELAQSHAESGRVILAAVGKG